MHVLKVGGHELDDPAFLAGLAAAVARLDGPLVVVHGGGRAIADLQNRLGLPVHQVDGLRVTDAASLQVAQMVLSGYTNKLLVVALLSAGVTAAGLSGVDGGLLRCHQKKHPTADLGFVGHITAVRPALLLALLAQGVTPVISPISLGEDGQVYNVNADEAAAALAAALRATTLSFVSNVPGVLDGHGRLIAALTPAETEGLITAGVVRDGMLPKVRAALDVVARGVPQARIVSLAGLPAGGTLFSASRP